MAIGFIEKVCVNENCKHVGKYKHGTFISTSEIMNAQSDRVL